MAWHWYKLLSGQPIPLVYSIVDILVPCTARVLSWCRGICFEVGDYWLLRLQNHLHLCSPKPKDFLQFFNSNIVVLLHTTNKLHPVAQRHVLLHFSAIAFAHGWKVEAMATQVVGESACYKWPSYVRGYHEYKSVCSPDVGETLRLTTGLTNPKDCCGWNKRWLCGGTHFKDSSVVVITVFRYLITIAITKLL